MFDPIAWTPGTHGGVQPYVALGRGLRQAGDVVTVGTGRDFTWE